MTQKPKQPDKKTAIIYYFFEFERYFESMVFN